MPPIPVTVIVVSFNTCRLLRRCLASLSDVDEVIVVDNASTDGSAEMVASEFPHVRLIQNRENRGFGAANNQGIDVAQHEIVLLLNSDAWAEAGSVAGLATAFDEPDIVAVGGRLRSPDGSTQNSCASQLTLWRLICEQLLLEKALPSVRLFNGYWLNRWVSSEQPTGVDQVMGACLMMRKSARFDERFFLYCEDTELCRRLQRAGRILFDPRYSFGHELGASSGERRWWSVAMYNRGKELYFRIHHGAIAGWAALAFNRFGALLRLVGWCAIRVFTLGTLGRGKPALFWRVLMAPLSGPHSHLAAEQA